MLTSIPKNANASSENSNCSTRSVRSFFKSFSSLQLPDSFANQESFSKPLKALHLAPSISHHSPVSPYLWTWIHCQDSMRPEITENMPFRNEMNLQRACLSRVFAYQGEPWRIPDYLMHLNHKEAMQQLQESTLKTLDSQLKPPLSKKSGRKSVNELYTTPMDKPIKMVKRFYVQIVDICMKNSSLADSIVCILKSGFQQHFSVRHLVVQEAKKGFGLLVHPSEGFLFDVNGDEILLDISLHGCSVEQGKVARRSSFMMFSPTKKSNPPPMNHRGMGEPLNPVVSKTCIGPALGQVNLSMNFQFKGSKTVETFDLTNGKKELGKIVLSFGCFMEEENLDAFKWTRAPVEPIADYRDFLNVFNSENSTWRKYWAVYQDKKLNIYDFEYKETKPAIASIESNGILKCKIPDAGLFYFPNSIQIQIESPKDKNEEWLNHILECGDEQQYWMYVSADSKTQRDEWMDKLNEIISKQSTSIPSTCIPNKRPMLPPRK